MKKLILFVFIGVLAASQLNAQEKYEEGYFKVQEVNENLYKEKILTDSERNKAVIAENIEHYNKMVKAYNSKEYKDAIKWAEEAFLGSIGEKIQFKVYQSKYDYANMLMQNQKLILFVSLCKSDGKLKYIQDVYNYCKEVLSDDRMAFVTKQAEEYNKTSKKKINFDEE